MKWIVKDAIKYLESLDPKRINGCGFHNHIGRYDFNFSVTGTIKIKPQTIEITVAHSDIDMLCRIDQIFSSAGFDIEIPEIKKIKNGEDLGCPHRVPTHVILDPSCGDTDDPEWHVDLNTYVCLLQSADFGGVCSDENHKYCYLDPLANAIAGDDSNKNKTIALDTSLSTSDELFLKDLEESCSITNVECTPNHYTFMLQSLNEFQSFSFTIHEIHFTTLESNVIIREAVIEKLKTELSNRRSHMAKLLEVLQTLQTL